MFYDKAVFQLQSKSLKSTIKGDPTKKVAETSLKVVHQSAEQLFYRNTSTLRNTTFQLLHCNACKKQNMYVIQLLKDAQFSLAF